MIEPKNTRISVWIMLGWLASPHFLNLVALELRTNRKLYKTITV